MISALMRFIAAAVVVLIASVSGSPFSKAQLADSSTVEWPSYGGDPGGSRYSPLTQINKGNVSQLKVAWELHTGDVSDGSNGLAKSEFEAVSYTHLPTLSGPARTAEPR